ncbi:polyketide cyclase/dehydrase/lipid transport protein [Ulvibacter sp. MAR_2010_11]|uniref:SRPBCC family protein n=1 Tax=Ulvibacter sp. MAR_2010_11 TaxID=1250229 RepID=UPI000C2CCDB3|nr:SRPBCC family protein [Ulvibacter sp. MAR_2010_11]PKA83955.1 polyketide cyclase/dehydrase/lipid transport protein [Ulvibacter sp. MAR_2010_11]
MIVIYILGGILAILLILMLVAPKTYNIQRSVVIKRPLGDVFQYLKLVKNQDHWSPWKKKDPDMKSESVGIDGTVGFINKWEGNKQVGSGEQEITKIVENERVDTELRFFKPWKSTSDGYLLVEAVDASSTKVIWGFKGTNKVPMNIMMLFFNMDKAVGKDFEEGLASLKTELEK